jgi:hypothetical protein
MVYFLLILNITQIKIRGKTEINPKIILPLKKIRTVENPKVVPKTSNPIFRHFLKKIETTLITWIIPKRITVVVFNPMDVKKVASSGINIIFARPELMPRPIMTTSIMVFNMLI